MTHKRGPLARSVARVRALTFLGLVFGGVVVVGFWLIPLAVLFRRPQWMIGSCVRFVRNVLPLFGVRVEVVGKEHLDIGTRALFVSNHQSFIDIPLQMGWVRFPSFLAKKEIESWPLFGPSMRNLGCVFVDRTDRESRRSAASRVRISMDAGHDFCIYPEGTRSVDGRVGPFSPGGFHIALEIGATLVPIALCGTGDVLHKHGFRLWPGRVRIVILPPIPPQEASLHDARTLARLVRDRIAAVVEEDGVHTLHRGTSATPG